METRQPDLLVASGALVIRSVDPCGEHALGLLREAAVEARALYPDLHASTDPWPTNEPTPDGGIYLLAYLADKPVGCAALRPIDRQVVEIRRMYVLKAARRHGLARTLLGVLEQQAGRLGYTLMRLETGNRQAPAIALYRNWGFTPIPAFGDYINDPVSLCFEKPVAPGAGPRIDPKGDAKA